MEEKMEEIKEEVKGGREEKVREGGLEVHRR